MGDHAFVLWLATLAYTMHIMEEFSFDWKTWANKVLHLEVDWPTFYLTNAAVIMFGICAAAIGWRAPTVSLAFPALMLINALGFHILPVLRSRQFSPGLFTALVLFIPLGIAAYRGAALDNVLDATTLILSLLLGALVMAYPIVLIKLQPHLAHYH